MLTRRLVFAFAATALLLSGCTAGDIVDAATNQDWHPHPPGNTPKNASAPIVQVLFESWTNPDRMYVADVQTNQAYGTTFSFDPDGPGAVTKRGVTSAIANSRQVLPEDDYHIVLEVTYPVPGGLSHWKAYCANGSFHHSYSQSTQRPSYYNSAASEPTTLYRLQVIETWDDPGPAVPGTDITTVPVALCDVADP